MPGGPAPRLFAGPPAVWERDGVIAAPRKAGPPPEGVDAGGAVFRRFVTEDDTPVGCGGLEAHGRDAVLRSVAILPSLRGRGFGAAIVAAREAAMRNARTIGLQARAHAAVFDRLG